MKLNKLSNEFRDNPELVATAAVGALGGFLKYFVKPELSAKRAWLAIGLGVTAYELTCPNGELLSEGVDRALERNRLLTTMAIGITAAHLCNVLPEQLDPFTMVTDVLKTSGR